MMWHSHRVKGLVTWIVKYLCQSRLNCASMIEIPYYSVKYEDIMHPRGTVESGGNRKF